MKILFIGSVIHPNDLMKFSGPSVAGNKMQLGIIRELEIIYGKDLSIITQIPISQFPKERKLFIKKQDLEISENIIANSIPFINFPFIKQLNMINHTKSVVKKWCKANKNEEKVILSFNALPQVSKPSTRYKNQFNLKTFVILADPPIDPIHRGLIKRAFKSLENKMSRTALRAFDGVIALNQKMIDDYTPNQKGLVIEGGLDVGQMIQSPELKNNIPFRMIYSGALTNYSGILNLLDSLTYIKNQDFVIEIYGSGQLQNLVIEKSLIDLRITYKGSVSNQEMMEIQRNANLLINPRVVLDPVSTYTFPSKIIEYLYSGTPTITTKVNGLLEEYFPYLFLFEDDSAKGIANGLNKILQMDQNKITEVALSAQEFVQKHKNWMIQTQKIVHFIESSL
ncbi:MAG: glycosyltransferase [Acholeplasmataceae bacterium]|nr:glycosyltransferase [Acholeplasmataceae bacterium]